MAYTPTEWNDGDLITAELLNKMEVGIQNEQVGPQGPKGDNGSTGEKGETGESGIGVKAISLTVSADGKVTSGTWTDTKDAPHDITVQQAEA